MKKSSIIVVSLLMAVLMFLLPACGAKTAPSEAPSMAMPEESYYDYGAYDDYAEAEYDAALNGSSEYSYETSTAPQPASGDAEIERKIIKDAYITMESDDAQVCYASILKYANQLGGYESSCQSRIDEYSSGRYVYIDAELRLPPDKLEDFVSKTGELGEVTYSKISQDEITEEYYDLTTRLNSKNTALKSYYNLLEKAETITDILEIQTRIDELTEEIEAIKGRLRVYDALVDESTVTLSITEYVPTAPAEKEFEWDSLSGSDFVKLVKNGFLGVCNFAWSLLQWIAIILISALPLIILGAAVFFIIRYFRKRSKKEGKQKNKKTVVQAQKNEAEAPAENEASAPDYK